MNVATIKEELYYRGVSVIIERRECIQTLKISKKLAKEAEKK
jgi:TPP-dependent indolepyruvate ferredoxin oxidoreductase alpha subunit